ncbi:chloride channel protein [Seohaeicola saemankumensis]|nr:chloride channel protein [Seohaeicola saemankumensis]MCA0869738.1 chloride channel protein [Seohaeicola saemankumensis]
MRIAIIAVGTSFVAGLFAAATLKLMMLITDLIWAREMSLSPGYIIVACTLGGALIGLTRLGSNRVETLRDQIEAAGDPVHLKRRQIWMVALGAALAVGFGGALGPEAGLIAVITELAALVSLVVARSANEARVLGQASVSAALGGLYASPPGATVFINDESNPDAWAAAQKHGIPYLNFVAALAGVGGFLVAARWLFDGGFHRIHLPHHVAPGDGTDILLSLLPAAFGAAVGAVFLHGQAIATRQVEQRIGHPVVQSALGGLAFGLLAALLPMVRFSGHHEFEPMLEWAAGATVWLLLGLALVKVLATVLCLSTGWRGGAIFPLIFAGGAAGYAAHLLQGGSDVAVPVAAGLAGATAAGLGKPLASLLILVFLIGAETLLPVCVGVAFGMVAARFSPSRGH